MVVMLEMGYKQQLKTHLFTSEDKEIAQLCTMYSFLPSFSNKKGILKTTLPLSYIPYGLVCVHTDVYIVAFRGTLHSYFKFWNKGGELPPNRTEVFISSEQKISQYMSWKLTDCIMLSTYVIKV